MVYTITICGLCVVDYGSNPIYRNNNEMKKSYTEKKRHKKPFNWIEALGHPQNMYDWEKMAIMTSKASNWVTCACGVQCSVLPRNQLGEPRDPKLALYGRLFNDHIQKMNDFHIETDRLSMYFEFARVNAIATLHKIERRSAYLLRKLMAKKKAKKK